MTTALLFLLLVAVGVCVWLVIVLSLQRTVARRLEQECEQHVATAEIRRQAFESEMQKLRSDIARLAKWERVEGAVEKARQLLASAEAKLSQAELDAGKIIADARKQANRLIESARSEAGKATSQAKAIAKELAEEVRAALAAATAGAAEIIAKANENAKEIAGKAYDVLRNADLYERTAKAMKNIIEGYGDEYLKPAESLLDELAEEFTHKDAGRELKLVRDQTKVLIKTGQAARCDYVESSRREGAERFVLDAFNGKVDSILSRVRHDNYGVLEQEIRDAFTLVNFGGKAFREARITDEYLAVRLAELKWATIAQELKRQEQEEQRQFREWIKEEQKAQREYERAMREAAKEEEVLRKAMTQAHAKIAAATEEQRALYEAQLAELNIRLQQAEERNQRAISMAQQTRRGHVYIISNLGSFGENIYKVGLTRRLEPLDRIRELGDASVPFEFDVHAIILSDDAPALETQLHKHFLLRQVNKINYRKEFFRADLAEIRREIESLGIQAHWTMVAAAQQYRDTLAIERAIESDPAARERWINRQLTLDPVEPRELVAAADE